MPAARDREWGRGRGRGQGQGLGRPAPRADMDWLAGSGRAVPVLEPVLPVVEMPRDSRGSLEVFGGAPARDRDRGPQVPALLPVTRARTPGRGRNCHSDGEGEGEEEKEGEEMEVESKWMAIPGGGPGKKAPVLMKEGAAKEAYPLPEKVELGLGAGTVAERAAQWGLVAKEELGRGRVGTRRSGEEAEEERKSGTSGRTSGGSEGEVVVPRVSRQVKEALGSFQQTFVVSDALQPGYPILYASAGFFSMTGYSAQEVMGHSCRFLQGADTDPEDVNKIRAALHDGTTFCGRILNYKKDGTPFWNLLTIAPIKDDTGRTIKFIGMQVEVSKFTEGSQATALRPNGLPHSLIKYDARQKATLSGSGAVADLVTAVTKPHKVIAEQEQEHGGGAAAPVPRRASQTGRQSIEEGGKRQQRSSGFLSLLGLERKVAEERDPLENFPEPELIMVDEEEREEEEERSKEMRRGIDLATTLERIEKNFVITDPRLPDNPIIFASDHFLELTEYRREEVLGRNCRFLQGPDTDRETVRMIGDAVRERREATVQLLNYTKSGKAFWNLFHLQPMRDQRGELQYFIGVQLDGSEQEATRQRLSERTEQESAAVVRATAHNVDAAASTLADAGLTPADLWVKHSKTVTPRPHKVDNPLWHAIRKVQQGGERLGLKHFRPIRPLGCGDTGSVHLVELRGSGLLYAMKAMDKSSMVNRNKVHRACAEREILGMMDHPFLPTLYASFQTTTHLCLITDFCPGGELFLMLERQPMKVLEEEAARFYAAEVVIALQYLHCMGVIYRDLKPENVLLQGNGHILLTDFDLSFLTSSRPRLIDPTPAHAHSDSSRRKRRRDSGMPIFCAEPTVATNSFVGTEEYIAPEIIAGAGHSAAVDWWALGILLYEMLYGRTPFRGRNRQKTFVNILNKELTFPTSIPVSLAARQLIRALLQRDPSSRLGALRGAHDIKTHPFFRSINWPLIRCSRPPLLDTPVHPDADIPMKTAHPADLEWDDMEATPHHHVTTSFTDVF